jgi:type II secretion system protein N
MLGKLFRFALGAFWLFLVFIVSIWVTFPSTAVGDRVRYFVYQQTDGDVLLHMENLRPWGFGVAMDNLMVFDNLSGRSSRDDDGPKMLVAADRFKASVGLFSMFGGAPRVSGVVGMGEGDVEFAVTAEIGQGKAAVTAAELDAEGFPLADLAALAGGTLGAEGGIDIHVDIDAEGGDLSEATGEVSLATSGITVTSWAGLPGVPMDSDFFQSVNLQIDEIDVLVDFDEGEGEVKDGSLVGSLSAVYALFGSETEVGPGEIRTDLEGTLNLKQDPMRSTMRLEALIGLADGLKQLEPQLGTPWKDGRVHYNISGTFARPSVREGSERATRSTASLGDDSEITDEERRSRSPEEEAERDKLRDERRKRREELRERLRTGDAREIARPDDPEEGDDFDDEEYDEEGGEDDEEFDEEDEEFEEEF